MALTVAAAALAKKAVATGANISKRLTRLASKNVQGGDILIERMKAELDEIRAMPVTNYREAQSKEARMRRLDNAAGTRAQGFQKAAKRAYNDDLVAQLNNPSVMSRMTKDQLTEAYAVQRRRLRGRLRNVTNSVGNNFMTRRAEKLLDNDPKNMTLNQLRSVSSKTAKALNSQTLTVAGANDHIEKGVDIVGEGYRSWSDEQRTAFWEAAHREMEMFGLTSPEALEVVKAAVNDKKYVALFHTASDTGKLKAILGRSLADAEAKKRREEVEEEKALNIIKRGFANHGADPLPFFSGNEESYDLPF